MSNLIPLEKAAAMLGLSVDRLTEMRSNNEIFAYRDGSSWKFKHQELERIAEELGITLRTSIAGEGDESDDFELSDSSSNSEPIMFEDSEELILDDSSDSGDALSSEKKVTDDGDDLRFGDSSLDLAAESSKKLKASDTGKLIGDKGAKGKGKGAGSSKKMLTGEDADDDDLHLADDDLLSDDLIEANDDSSELSSDFDDSELVLDDSDSETDIPVKGKGKTGKPSRDSGRDLSLSDDALELGGSDIDSLELSDDGEMISLAEAADADAATMMQEDDFNLTPIEGGEGEESSGSQVIALEDSDLFSEESAETQVQQKQQPALISDGEYQPGQTTMMASGPGVIAVPISAEPPFSMGQILALSFVAFILLAGGMVAYDLARNLWMPNDTVVSSGPLKFFLQMTGMD